MYRKISIRNNLITQVERIMEKTDRYRSIADFVSEAVRLRIETLEKQHSTKQKVKANAG